MGAKPAGISVICYLPQIRSYVPMLVPIQRAGKHNCTRSSGMYVTVAADHSHVLMICLLSPCMSVTVSSYQHPCILHLHQTINDVCNNCVHPFAMAFTVAPNQQSRLLNLLLQVCMSDTLVPDQHLYLL